MGSFPGCRPLCRRRRRRRHGLCCRRLRWRRRLAAGLACQSRVGSCCCRSHYDDEIYLVIGDITDWGRDVLAHTCFATVLVVQWSARLARDREVMGPNPAATKTFFVKICRSNVCR